MSPIVSSTLFLTLLVLFVLLLELLLFLDVIQV